MRKSVLAGVCLVAAVAAAITLASAQPNSAAFTREIFGEYNYLARKAAHFVEFALLFLACRWTVGKLKPGSGLVSTAVCFLITVAFAFLDEWHQSFVPGRTASLDHVTVDAAGAFAAAISWTLWQRLQRCKSTRSNRR